MGDGNAYAGVGKYHLYSVGSCAWEEGAQKMKLWYVYILHCSDGTLYTGSTDDVQRRLATHNSGKGAKYTRSRLPVELLYTECYESCSAALKREYAIKQLSRSEKWKLIEMKKAAAE